MVSKKNWGKYGSKIWNLNSFRWSGNCFLFGLEEETQPYKMTFVMSAMAQYAYG